jgi:hypothetical protein
MIAMAALPALAADAAADLDVAGNWTITGIVSMANQVINVTNTSATDGHILILPGGELHLENATLLVPNNRTVDNQGYLDIRNSTVTGPNWMLYLWGAATLQNVDLQNPCYDMGSGRSGTYIVSAQVTLDRVRWDRTSADACPREWYIHIRTPMDFKGNVVGSRGQLRYELPPLSTSTTLEIADNQFALASSFLNWSSALAVDDVFHNGVVVYDIHHNSFRYGLSGIVLGSSSPTTSYLIHDSTFFGVAFTGIDAGRPGVNSRFFGNLAVWNVSFTNVTRAAHLYGDSSVHPVATMDNVSVANCTYGVLADEATWVIRNSSFVRTDPQYTANTNGHILIWDTLDGALQATAFGANSSVEHFIFLDVRSMMWQAGIAVTGDLVSFKDPTATVTLTADPASWTPQEVAWWGVYDGAVQVDRRDLRPTIIDGRRTFACTPAQFYVAPGMAPVDVVCTDDSPPTVAVKAPAGPVFQNSTTALASGTVVELGAGLTSLDWSLNNASWAPATLSPEGLNWTFAAAALPDGTYPLFLRAVDRAGQVTLVQAGPATVDTVVPTVTMPQAPPYAAGTSMALSGMTEPGATVSFLSTGGLTGSTAANATGGFSLFVPLVEGVNAFALRASDPAGNTFALNYTVVVDNVPPSLAVALANWGATREPVLAVTGLTEATARVTVDGRVAQRNADGFSLDAPLVPGVNELLVNATDPAGNLAQWYGIWWYDADDPVVAASVSTGDQTAEGVPVTRSGAVPVTGSAVDGTSAIAVFAINGINYSLDGAGAFFVSFPVMEGDNTLVVTATDLVGNTARVTVHVLRDSTAPTAVATPQAGDAPLMSVGGEAYTRGSTVVVSLVVSEDGAATVGSETRAVTAGANLFTVALVEGRNPISVALKDRAGNPRAPSTLLVVRDTSAPSLALSSPAAGAVLDDSSATVEGVTEAGATVTVNGVQAPVTVAGGFSVRVALGNGTTTLTVTVADALGNNLTTSREVTRATASAATPEPKTSPDVVWVAAALGAGIALGLVLRGRRAVKPPQGSASPGESPSQAPSLEEPGPKGPRGPQPPGGG